MGVSSAAFISISLYMLIHEVKECAPFRVVVWSKLFVDIFVQGEFGVFLMIPKYPNLFVRI